MIKLGEFTEFLKTVPLNEYRKRYAHIKLVEMDLPKDIQVINLLLRSILER